MNIDRELTMIQVFFEDKTLTAEAHVADHLQGERELPHPTNKTNDEDFQ